MATQKIPYRIVMNSDPLLKVVSQQVQFPYSEDVDDCVDECINTIRKVRGFWHKKCLSIAAPQVGYQYRLFVMCDPLYWHHDTLMYKKMHTFYNPEILEYSKDKIDAWEGCISNDTHMILVNRPTSIKFRFTSVKGSQHNVVC